MTRLEIFYQVFPREAIDTILTLTNEKLARGRSKKLTEGELIRFIGLIILATRFEFGSRRELWSQTKKTKYEEAPEFGRQACQGTGSTKYGRHLPSLIKRIQNQLVCPGRIIAGS